MSEYKCPKCGGELRDADYSESVAKTFLLKCESCARWWQPPYLKGYWDRDAEEKAKRCDGCLFSPDDCPDGGHTWHCSSWEAK